MDNRFVVYNASAGSGKTFQIATHYLNKLIQAQEPTYIYRLLGITFTNKAAGEMKERVLQNLINASKGKITDVMAQVALQSEDIIKMQTGITSEKDYQAEIVKRCQQRLTEILHHYDDFQLTTIDKMMYKIIRTFARDMNLPVDVEVILDHKEVIINLIDKLIAKAVRGEELTEFFINLSLSKVDEEKSWKIQQDLLNINDIIFDDNYFTEIKSLEGKSFVDFKRLKKKLYADNKQITDVITQRAEKFVAAYKTHEIYVNGDFKSLINKMFSVAKYFDVEVKPRLRGILDSTDPILYIKGKQEKLQKTNPELAHFIAGTLNDTLQQLSLEVEAFINGEFKQLIEKHLINKGLLKQINALSIQKALLDEIEAYKDETHSIFISDFNKLILEQILKHLATDTPYIYMRLGEKYSHYFIDEFQDTSELQWHNLIPLIHEALSKEFSNEKLGDAMLVGDAKQSIYRFRGGKPEQFIALSDENNPSKQANPFKEIVRKKVENLAYNWRSESNIITFNNHFFETFSDYLHNPDYQKVYQKVSQKIPDHKQQDSGFVQIRFLEKEDKSDKETDKIYALAVRDAIIQAEENGFKRDEICVLIDRHAIGVEIAETLTRNSIDIISSETLLVQNSAKVQFLISWIRFLEKAATEDFYPAMHYLQESQGFDANKLYASVLKTDKGVKLSKKQRVDILQDFGYHINYEQLIQMNLYDLVVYLIQQFKLNETSNEQAYLQAFVEEIHQYYSKTQGGIRSFLLHWQNIEDDFKENTIWINVDPKQFEGFSQLPVEMKVLEKSIRPEYQYLYEKASGERAFDNLNRLYVALTRASEQLYVVLDSLPKNPNDAYNSIFNNFIDKNILDMATKDDLTYTFGQAKRQKLPEETKQNELQQNKLYFRNWQANEQNKSLLKINTKSFERWQEDKKNAILFGMQLHDILSKIDTYTQWKKHKKKYIATVKHEAQEIVSQQIETVLTHPDLLEYYTEKYQILNERDILIPQKDKAFTLRRPDRMVLKNNQLIIIDYKTGAYNKHHEKQLIEYAGLLTEIGYEVSQKILVYIKDTVKIIIV